MTKTMNDISATPPTRAPRGSILVFSIVLLSIVAMLGVAFLIVTKQAVQAAKASLDITQADNTAKAGDAHVLGSLHPAASNRSAIGSESGVLMTSEMLAQAGITPSADDKILTMKPNWSAAWTIDAQNNPVNPLEDITLFPTGAAPTQGSGYNSPLTMFVHDMGFEDTHTVTQPTYAMLSSVYRDGITTHDAIDNRAPFYTTAPMRIATAAPDRASVRYLRATMTDYYNSTTNRSRKTMAISGTLRGRHYQWIRDLDAIFYGDPAMWGIRPPEGGPTAQTIATNILANLFSSPEAELPQTVKTALASDIQTLVSPQAPLQFDSINELAKLLPSYTALPEADFELWRENLAVYFSPYADFKRDGNNNLIPFPQYKNTSAAININTAPVEVIAALLSQIPETHLTNGSTFQSSGKNVLLARRIVAKRPFLCRMDFEDFAASLLPGTLNALDAADPAALSTPVGMVNFAMSKRGVVNPGNPLMRLPEISLSQYLEIPGLPEDDVAPNATYPEGFKVRYKKANWPERMGQRFTYFYDDMAKSDDSLPMPTRAECLLSVTAFNNLLNSLSTSPGPSQKYDVLMPTGSGSTATAYQVVLRPAVGTSSNLDHIMLGGDDTFEFDANGVAIAVRSGKNGVAETTVFGYSYYSHDYTEQDYKPALLPEYNLDVRLQDPKYMGKFVYGDPNQAQTPEGEEEASDVLQGYAPVPRSDAKEYKNYSMADLQMWSCVGDGTLSGYYDLWFNPNDVMLLDLGAQPKEPAEGDETPIESTQVIKSFIENDVVRTGIDLSDDLQETDVPGEVFFDYDIVVTPGPNKVLETKPKRLSKYANRTAGDDIKVKAIRIMNDAEYSMTEIAEGDTWTVSLDGHLYIIPEGPFAEGETPTLHSTIGAPDPNNPNPDPTDVDEYVEVIIDGGNHITDTIVPDDTQDTNTEILIGQNAVNDTAVWGPMRASQRPSDQRRMLALIQGTFLTAADNQIPAALNVFTNPTTQIPFGDVAWSPQITFRTRFFTSYVLAQGLNSHPVAIGTWTQTAAATPGTGARLAFEMDPSYYSYNADTQENTGASIERLVPGSLIALKSAFIPDKQDIYVVETVPFRDSKTGKAEVTLACPLEEDLPATGVAGAVYTNTVIGEHRIESAYDAFKDEVLWRREPVSERRSVTGP